MPLVVAYPGLYDGQSMRLFAGVAGRGRGRQLLPSVQLV
ncbi:MAG: hypothetical protein ACLSDQ_13960 [Adlercreutzia equolifaciens]